MKMDRKQKKKSISDEKMDDCYYKMFQERKRLDKKRKTDYIR